MQDLITSFIIQSKECKLAEIGKFTVITKPAKTDIANKQITPSFKEIHFNKREEKISDELVKYVADKKDNNYDVYVDGGIIANYPISIFDSNPEYGKTLGLKLDRPEQIDYRNYTNGIAPYPIHSVKQYVGALYNIIIENLNTEKDNDAERTVYISTSNIQPKIRRVSEKQRNILYDNGKLAVEQFFNNN